MVIYVLHVTDFKQSVKQFSNTLDELLNGGEDGSDNEGDDSDEVCGGFKCRVWCLTVRCVWCLTVR